MYSENLNNCTIFNVEGKMFANEYASEVEVARANEYNPIEYIQYEMDNYALEGCSDYEDFKVTDKETFAY